MVLASLNHPNIGAIYGLEEADSLWFLVLELVPGETLAERLRRGPIPFAEALELAGQIADALAAAHDNGVIHRDLKPANIKITPDGQIKVLDFGLAKALADEPADGQLSDSPTLSAHATKVGVILGTAAYMSPEQARGRSAEISKSLVKRRWSESDARAVVSAWRRSGKRISEFAIENGLSAKRVYRWSARLEGGGKRKVRFHPVRLVGGEGAPIEVELLNGRRVRVREGFSSEELRRVLEVVEGGE